MRTITIGLVLAAMSTIVTAQRTATAVGPADLQVENLKTLLGIDDPAPHFSWQLHDPARDAKQSAYRIAVASTADRLLAGKPDIWDSGRIESSQSIGIPYNGPALKPSTRYYWRVELWGSNGLPYRVTPIDWWETGLMAQDAWRASWIGYETPEESTVRHAPSDWIAYPDAKSPDAGNGPQQRFEYRTTVTLTQPARFAALYATGQDTVAAWINGSQVLHENPLPSYHQMPWKKFVRADVTRNLNSGSNTVAIEAVHYVVDPNGQATADAPPMIATLVVEYADGTWTSFSSNPNWKSAVHAAPGWQQKGFDDAGWKPAVKWQPLQPARSSSLGEPWIPDSVKALHHQFTTGSRISSARLYVTALGEYEVFLNGKRVGDQFFSPGWTDYRERVIYQTYDVTRDLLDGSNVISALLAPGWYETPLEWAQQPNNYGLTPPALRAMLRIEHIDGSVEWINTDSTWQAAQSYILHSELYDGESQDARLWHPHWPDSRTPAGGWHPSSVVSPAPVAVQAEDFQPIRVERRLNAKSLTEPKPGVWVYDFGQNFSGVEQLRLSGPAGTNIRVRFAEVLNPDGSVYTDNLRTAKATDHFILNGDGIEEFTPQFTFHGFRYAELTGLPTAPDKQAVSGSVLHTDAPFTTQLTTGSPMINQLWSNILWGQRSNFVGLPTDCPQRDERLGWMGDAEVFWRTASYNMDLAAFSRKFAADIRGTQNGTPYFGIYSPGTITPNAGWAAGWSDAGIIIPWTSWLQTGDKTIIEQNWAAMTRYLDAIASKNPDSLWKNDAGTPYGDWLSPEGKTNYVLIATAYWAYDATLMEQMARATGRTQQADNYAQLFERIRAAFQKQFVRSDGFVAGADNSASQFGVINNPNAKSAGGDTQTGYVLALHMNLIPQSLRATAAKRLVGKIHANHDLLGTGFLGTPYLLEVLTKAGYTNLAYSLLLNTRYPSWGYMVEHGATTMWERWNGDQMMGDPSMNSFNHYAYGAVGEWMYRYAAGIDATPSDAGFHTVVLHPSFDARLGHLSFDYDSSYGPIHSDWTVTGQSAVWHVTIPANTSGWLPLTSDEISKYSLDGVLLSHSKQAKPSTLGNQPGFELPPGSYTFEIRLE